MFNATMFTKGQDISSMGIVYNGKSRAGIVEEVHYAGEYIKVKEQDGKFKTFVIAKMSKE